MLFTILLLIMISCRKKAAQINLNCCTAAPPTALFEIIDQNGNGMVMSLKDRVMFSYADSGKTKAFKEHIGPLNSAWVNASTKKKFNGIVIEDIYSMAVLSTRLPNPIHTFNLSLNGEILGVVYFDYANYKNSLSQSTTSTFTFNSLPVKNLRVPGGRSYISVLQVKQ